MVWYSFWFLVAWPLVRGFEYGGGGGAGEGQGEILGGGERVVVGMGAERWWEFWGWFFMEFLWTDYKVW